jgi:hypothetical protein
MNPYVTPSVAESNRLQTAWPDMFGVALIGLPSAAFVCWMACLFFATLTGGLRPGALAYRGCADAAFAFAGVLWLAAFLCSLNGVVTGHRWSIVGCVLTALLPVAALLIAFLCIRIEVSMRSRRMRQDAAVSGLREKPCSPPAIGSVAHSSLPAPFFLASAAGRASR